MKRLKWSAGILGLVVAHKIGILKVLGLNMIDNLLVMDIGFRYGINLETVLISIALSLVMYFIIKEV